MFASPTAKPSVAAPVATRLSRGAVALAALCALGALGPPVAPASAQSVTGIMGSAPMGEVSGTMSMGDNAMELRGATGGRSMTITLRGPAPSLPGNGGGNGGNGGGGNGGGGSGGSGGGGGSGTMGDSGSSGGSNGSGGNGLLGQSGGSIAGLVNSRGFVGSFGDGNYLNCLTNAERLDDTAVRRREMRRCRRMR